MKKQLSLFIVGLLLSITSFGQSINDYFDSEASSSFHKLYLHTDREYYFVGDTLWFSPYLIQANNNKLLVDDCNLYVELIDSKGQLIEERNFILDKGVCSGYLNFNDKIISAGTYVLRAYTDNMKKMGAKAFFQKEVKINDPRRDEGAEKLHTIKKEKVILDLYPEGGFLIDGKVNRMAFVAHNQEGKRVKLKGRLLNSRGDQVIVKTDFKGAGSFFFVPKLKEKYKIEAEGYGNAQFRMPKISQQGTKLMLSKIMENGISVCIISSENTPPSEYYIALFHRGIGRNFIKIEKEKQIKPVTIKSDYLGAGVNRLVLLNAQFEPISERLVFINKRQEDCLVEVKLGKDRLQTREELKVKLSIPTIKTEEEWARLSVSVINENMMGYKGNLLDIRSYLLLDSELKGHIQTPNLYFVDSDGISSAGKLDLLMMTHGWRNYIWSDTGVQDEEDKHSIVSGVTFSGKVRKNYGSKPFANTDVYLTIANKDNNELFATKTNENGRFEFDPVMFFDTTLVMIQGKNYNGKNYTRVELDDLGFEHFPIDESIYKNTEDIEDLSLEMYRLKYLNELSLMKFVPDRQSRILKEINVIAKPKLKKSSHFRIYSKPTQSKKLTDSDRNYQNVMEYLRGRFAGVRVVGDSIVIRGAGSINGESSALILVDGMPVRVGDIRFMTMHEIDMVEVIKPPETTVFGVRGANGVISILTRTGIYNDSVMKEIPGTIIKRIQGFEKFCLFYSPVYDDSNVDSDMPDYRQTLYWNPAVIVDDETKLLSFFTCDNLANYRVVVEGLTSTGKICIGKADFVVDERRW